MIYAAAKPIEEYVIEYNGGTYGLYEEYNYDPELLALIMISTAIPYDYEIPGISTGEVAVRVINLEPYTETLKEEIEGVPVRELLRTMNPLLFFQFISVSDLSKLTLTKEIFKKGKEDMSYFLPILIAARAAVWASNYRGRMKATGNVVSVNFSGGLTVPAYMLEKKDEIEKGILRKRGGLK